MLRPYWGSHKRPAYGSLARDLAVLAHAKLENTASVLSRVHIGDRSCEPLASRQNRHRDVYGLCPRESEMNREVRLRVVPRARIDESQAEKLVRSCREEPHLSASPGSCTTPIQHSHLERLSGELGPQEVLQKEMDPVLRSTVHRKIEVPITVDVRQHCAR